MPGRHGYAVQGGWAQGGGGSSGIGGVPASLSISSRQGNTPPEYVASQEIEFTEGFKSGTGDAFEAYLTEGSSGSGAGGTYAGGGYRYGFNGKEKDAESGIQDYGFRIYNPSIGRFLSVDPITKEYLELTPYQFASNRVIDGIDQDGLEFVEYGYPISRIQERYRNAKTPEDFEKLKRQDRNGMLVAGSMLGAGFLGTSAAAYSASVIVTTLQIANSARVMYTISTATLLAAKYGPDFANFTYGVITGDANEPIPTNTGSQSADVGAALRGLFKAPVKVGGWLRIADVESFNFIKGTKGGKVAVIGEGMERVLNVANGLKNAEVFKPTAEALEEWRVLLNGNPGKVLSDKLVKGTLMYKENEAWAKAVKEKGYDVLDIGATSGKSTCYNMEKEALYGKSESTNKP